MFVFVDGEALSILQVNALDLHGYLDPEYSDYPYFALRECPLENVARAAYWLTEGESVKDLQIVTVTFYSNWDCDIVSTCLVCAAWG